MFSAKGLKKMAAKATGLGNSSNDELEDEDGDVFHDAAEAVLHPDAAPADSGGLACNDMQLLSRQRRQARVNMKLK